jgi:hypothetical protein
MPGRVGGLTRGCACTPSLGPARSRAAGVPVGSRVTPLWVARRPAGIRIGSGGDPEVPDGSSSVVSGPGSGIVRFRNGTVEAVDNTGPFTEHQQNVQLADRSNLRLSPAGRIRGPRPGIRAAAGAWPPAVRASDRLRILPVIRTPHRQGRGVFFLCRSRNQETSGKPRTISGRQP